MNALNTEPQIVSMAHALGVRDADRVEGIKIYCRNKVRRLVSAEDPIKSIEDLERMVCERLNLTIIEIWTEEELTAVIENYARKEKELAFAALRRDLDPETYATLIRLKRKPGQSEDHYVAIIDCRFEKGMRRFFTRWHEIAHVLTLFEQVQFPV